MTFSMKESDVSSLKDVEGLSGQEKLDVSNNLLVDLDGISACEGTLKWLNASHNTITSVKHLKESKELNVLNLGYNKITSLKHLKKLKALKAAILNSNKLATLDGLTGLKELNTLVVSSNQMTSLDVMSFPKLQKLSATNNEIEEFPNLQLLKDIGDVKLNQNLIKNIPEWIEKCTRLKILDLGNNKLSDFKSIASLSKLPNLNNLNLKGNSLCDDPDYIFKIKEMLPNLRTLDFKKLSDLYFKALEEKSKNEKNLKKPKAVEKTINRGFKKTVTLKENCEENLAEKKMDKKSTEGIVISKENCKTEQSQKLIVNEDEDNLKTSSGDKDDSEKETMKTEVTKEIKRKRENLETEDTTTKKKSKKNKSIKGNDVSTDDNLEMKDTNTEEKSKKRKSKKKKKDASTDKKLGKKRTGVISLVKIKKTEPSKDLSIKAHDFGFGSESSW